MKKISEVLIVSVALLSFFAFILVGLLLYPLIIIADHISGRRYLDKNQSGQGE